MKVRVVAHTSDVHGTHIPGDVIDLAPGEAEAWIKRGWAKFDPSVNPPEENEPKESSQQEQSDMQTAENFERETAVMPRQRGRKIKAK